ncbi:galanin receptor type 1-like [Antedon mediterranea]|uniref:galanin receptor type 1-like n=1 Tax=Antedon mediterranea TaxID=105859 RepID=UPI003AF7F44A
MANVTDYEKNVLHGHPAILVIRYTIGIVGVLANLLVVLVFIFKKIQKKSSTHLLIFHQSWVDMAGSLMFVIYYTRDPPVGVAGEIFCKSRAIFWYLLYVSTNNLVLVTIERYVAVLHSNWYRMKFSRRKRKGLVLIIPHFIALVMAMYLAVAATVNKDKAWQCDYNVTTRTLEVLSGILVFMFCWLIPTTLMIYCYARIFNMIKEKVKIEVSRSQHDLTSSGGKQNSVTPKNKMYGRAQQNLIVTLFCVFIAFIICITPNFALYMTYALCRCFEFNSSPVHEITVTLLAINLSVNPFIYAFKFNDFRKGLQKLKQECLVKVGFDVSDTPFTESTADEPDTNEQLNN